MNVQFSSLLGFLFLWGQVDSDCLHGFTEHSGSCYTVVREEATWADANVYCHVFGSKLVTIESADESKFVADLAHRIAGGWSHHPSFWLGASDVLSEGTWEWVEDRHALRSYYSNWRSGNPDNGGSDDQDENCLEMDSGHHYQWNDNQCSSEKYFICEKPKDGIDELVHALVGR